jgi:hypothetical protein
MDTRAVGTEAAVHTRRLAVGTQAVAHTWLVDMRLAVDTHLGGTGAAVYIWLTPGMRRPVGARALKDTWQRLPRITETGISAPPDKLEQGRINQQSRQRIQAETSRDTTKLPVQLSIERQPQNGE